MNERIEHLNIMISNAEGTLISLNHKLAIEEDDNKKEYLHDLVEETEDYIKHYSYILSRLN
ncbi:hypothetical protein [Terrisporobacter sp.]|uniref:hypothetical protein n=1 Tax=Terrisporobacter sp. TaxID=1965305 RepID=UPI00289CE77E|nr:hypothetical protein [Terrisporobacter sp.]